MSGVLEALRARIAAGSRPGDRADGLFIALSIEGGGSRSAYSAGMALAIDELGLLPGFDAVYGTSGGALNAAWLVSGEGKRWLPSWGWDEVIAERVVDPRRVLRGGALVDTRHLVEHVYFEVTPMNFAAILSSPITLHPLAVDAHTRAVVDLAPHIHDSRSLRAALRASAALPLLAGRPVRLGGREWFDGGLGESVPLATPVAQGVTHLMVLRTVQNRPPTPPSRWERSVLEVHSRFRLSAPAPTRQNPVDLSGTAIDTIWAPDDGPAVGRLSRDGEAIGAAVEAGRMAAQAILSASPNGPNCSR